MKFNFRCFVLIILITIIYYVTIYLGLGILYFFIYGSGAGASKPEKIKIFKSLFYIFISIPILYNLFRMYRSKKMENTRDYNCYLIITIILIIFWISNTFMEFIYI